MKYVGVSTPAWTLVGDRGNRGGPIKKTTIGPATPERDHEGKILTVCKDAYPKAPEWKFGRGKEREKQFQKKDNYPGPGTYEKKNLFNSKKSSGKRDHVISRAREMKYLNELGPGAYNPRKLTRSMPKFSFGYKFTEEREEEVVGPGKYDPKLKMRKSFNKSKLGTFGRSRRKGTDEMRKTCAPGPGSYFKSASSKRFRIGKKKKKKTMSRGEFCTFGSRSHSRFKRLKSETPGVGRYDLNTHTIEKWIKATGSRTNKKTKETDINFRNKSSSKNMTPGPCHYSIKTDLTKSTAPSYGFGTGNRPPLNIVDMEIPGPASYIGNVLSLEEFEELKRQEREKDKDDKSKNKFFGTANRGFGGGFKNFGKGSQGMDGKKAASLQGKKREMEEEFKEQRIWVKNPLFSGPKFSFKGRRGKKFNKDKLKFPGPGAYYTAHNFMIGLDNPHHIIGTSDRFKQLRKKDMLPGPGEYEIAGDLDGQGAGFAKGLRKDPANVDPEIEVGPDTYDIKSTVPQLQAYENKAQEEAGFKFSLV